MAEDYQLFTERVYDKLGIDLQKYKEAQMKRRLTSLREKRGFNNFTAYFQAISNDINLLNEFVDRITINVSEFYRNPRRWEVLKEAIIPKITEGTNELFIWSAACSTGEEPYSIAILMKEYFPEIHAKILATDIDGKVLEKAMKGVYSERALKELPSSLQAKYFKQIGEQYEVESSIRRLITFKKHNLLEDKYPSKVDLIICRNVLIYFTDKTKDIIYRNFSDALSHKGVLFVGSTEQIFTPTNYGLKLLDTFFYQKIDQ